MSESLGAAAAGNTTGMEKAAELEKGILLQVRSEKNMILSSSDADSDQFVAEIGTFRTSVAKTRDEIYAVATEAGRKYLDRFSVVYSSMNAVQDQTIKLAKLDKAKATERSMAEGRNPRQIGATDESTWR